jgi:hypothetical protein
LEKDMQFILKVNVKKDKNLEQNLDKSNEKLHISDVMCSLPVSVVKDLVKAY